MYLPWLVRDAKSAVRRSAIFFEKPSTLIGLAALSVEIFTNTSTPVRCAALRTVAVPSTFV